MALYLIYHHDGYGSLRRTGFEISERSTLITSNRTRPSSIDIHTGLANPIFTWDT